MYLSDASGLGAARKWVHRRQPATGSKNMRRAAWRGSAHSVRRCSTSSAPTHRAAPRSTRPAATPPYAPRCGRPSGWQTSPQPRSTRLSKCHQPAAMRMPDAPRDSLPSSSATIRHARSRGRATRSQGSASPSGSDQWQGNWTEGGA